jgi:hypothetical protein
MPVDIVARAKARREEIKDQKSKLDAEDADLAAFLATADRLAAQLGSDGDRGAATPPASKTPLKAGKKEIVGAALALIKTRQGAAVQTREIVEQLEGFGYSVGTASSSPSSIVSANLSQAEEMARSPDGNGWVLSKLGETLS